MTFRTACILGVATVALSAFPAAAHDSPGSYGSYINSQQHLYGTPQHARRSEAWYRAQAERRRARARYRREPGNFVDPFRDTSWDGYRYSNPARYW